MSPAVREVLAGTTNPHKAEEIRRILSDFPLDVLDLSGWEAIPEVPEEGRTFEENAITKARFYARLTGLVTIGEDSGLEVDALGGEPGIYSARFAGETSGDDENNRLLLEKLRGVPPGERTARFRCAMALSSPERLIFTCHGSAEGIIAGECRGESGFGYDPLFFVPGYGGTFGELGPGVKDRLSHRARALAEFRERFGDYFSAAEDTSGTP